MEKIFSSGSVREISCFVSEIFTDHRRFSTESRRLFFDPQAIRRRDDWRQSRLLLVCLAANYFRSE